MNERLAPPGQRRTIRAGAVVAVAAAIAFVVWLVVRDDDGSRTTTGPPPPSQARPATPVAMTPAGLRALSVELGHPLYWVGPQANTTYEVTQATRGRVYIRYLPRGVPLGIRSALFPIVGTYPVRDAFGVLTAVARRRGSVSFQAPDNSFAVFNRRRPLNVYVAFAGSDLQIEVFDPTPQRARRLVLSGQLTPIR